MVLLDKYIMISIHHLLILTTYIFKLRTKFILRSISKIDFLKKRGLLILFKTYKYDIYLL